MASEVLDVFGVSSDLVESYIERESVDGEFLRAISLGKQIIVYGSSKQGKTSLVKKHLDEDSMIQVECSPLMDLIDIYSSILRQAGVNILIKESDSSSDSKNLSSKVSAKIKIPLIGEVGGGVGAGCSGENISCQEYKSVEYNLSLSQDILEILREYKFNKTIVIENFHYLREEVQRLFSFDLRTFQDAKIRFVIVGIWRERNRLAQFNGDLQDRMVEVAVEPWSKEDFYKVMEKGEEILNLDFSVVRDSICSSCFDSVGVLQELCKECCFAAGIRETVSEKKAITGDCFNIAKRRKLEDYSGRHLRSFESFVSSSRKDRGGIIPLFIPYYFIRVLLTSDFSKISEGFKRKYLHEKIFEIHHRPKEVRPGDMSNFLYSLVKYQISKGVEPPLFDYDQSIQTLRVIDSTLYFFLRECDLADVLENIPLPSGELFFNDST